MTRTRLLSLAVVAALGAALVAGCGGSGGDEDPQQVLDETFSNDKAVDSGVLDLSLSASAEGEDSGSIDASLSGPFQGDEQKQGEFPQFDLTVDASGEGQGDEFDFEGGLTATTDEAFVTYQDTTYEVPSGLFNQFKKASERAQREAQRQGDEDAGAVFDQLGIDPSGWLTNLENEGDEDVEGTETIHIRGDADVPAILEDVRSLFEAGGQTLDQDAVSEIDDAVDEASIDVYSGKDDQILRKLEVNLELTPPEDSEGSVDNVDVEFSVTLSDVNEEQTIDAPSDARSFSDLEQALGLPSGLLETLLEGGDLSGGGLGGLESSSGGQGSQKIKPEAGTTSNKYLDCIAKAQSAEELQACEP